MSYIPVDPRPHIFQRNSRSPSGRSDIELRTEMASPLRGNDSNSGFASRDRSRDGTANNYENLESAIWRPGFWAQFPIWGLLSLFGVLGSTIAGVVILVVSDHLPVNDWHSQFTPAVSMAICSVVANALLAYALAHGLVISFWRTALRGHTLAELNQNWLCGHSLQHALIGGFRVGGRITALACILSVVSLLRGPLNQRASHIESNILYNTSGTIPITVAQQLTEGYTGIARDSRAPIMEISRLTPDFAQVMQEYSERSNISIDTQDGSCGDSCTAFVKGFGFKSQCGFKEYVQYQESGGAFDLSVFTTSSTIYQVAGSEKDPGQRFWLNAGMQLNVTQIVPNLPDDVAPENATLARLRTHICNVTGGIVEYKVQLLSSDSVSLLGGRSDDRFLEDLVLPGPGTFGADSTIGGFAYAASYLFASEAVLNFAGAVSGFTFTGSLANQQVQSVNLSNITFGDPMDYMLDTMREIAFRTSVRAGKDQDSYNVTNAEQKVAYTGTATRSVYVTDFGYMAGAAAVSILSVLAVGLTFYGWWELGNNVSLSPLDIARAFDAPLLKLESPGLVGMQRVQYGKEISGEEDAQAKEIGGQYSETGRRRLVMGLTGTVKRPSAGEVVVL